eukprot:1151186-Pelagomonas_calceolata.AAC.18
MLPSWRSPVAQHKQLGGHLRELACLLHEVSSLGEYVEQLPLQRNGCIIFKRSQAGLELQVAKQGNRGGRVPAGVNREDQVLKQPAPCILIRDETLGPHLGLRLPTACLLSYLESILHVHPLMIVTLTPKEARKQPGTH